MKKQVIILGLLLCFSRPVPAPALSLFPFAEGEPREDVTLAEYEDYRILYHWTGFEETLHPPGGAKEAWRELSYKLVVVPGKVGSLFGEDGWVEVRFLDKDGFAVVTDYLDVWSLTPEGEYYAFLWVEAERIGRLRGADVQPIPYARFLKINRWRQNSIEAFYKKLDETKAYEEARRREKRFRLLRWLDVFRFFRS